MFAENTLFLRKDTGSAVKHVYWTCIALTYAMFYNIPYLITNVNSVGVGGGGVGVVRAVFL